MIRKVFKHGFSYEWEKHDRLIFMHTVGNGALRTALICHNQLIANGFNGYLSRSLTFFAGFNARFWFGFMSSCSGCDFTPTSVETRAKCDGNIVGLVQYLA